MQHPLLLAVALGALVAVAPAQDFTYAIDASSSSITVAADLALDFDGNLRGVFDAEGNPRGTRTLAGFLGDPGTNAEIPLSLGLLVGLDLGGALAGDFDLAFDPMLGAVEVSAFSATIGGAGTSGASLDLSLMYDTFRTVSPTALFLGGFPLTLPLGNVAIEDVTVVQSAAGIGVATPAAAAGLFDVAVLVPVEISFTIELGGILGGGGGEPTPVGPIPLVLPINGTFDLADCGTALSSTAGQTFSTSIPSPVPLSFEDLPLDLPTILPPGGVANLLLTADLDTLDVSGTLDATLSASSTSGRVVESCPGIVNSSGLPGRLGALNAPSVGAADLTFVMEDLPLDSFGYLIMSPQPDSVPGFGGSKGTLCVGSPVFGFADNVLNSGLLGETSFAPDFANLPMGQQFGAGDTWYFQYWYRDLYAIPTSNTTSALRVVFCR